MINIKKIICVSMAIAFTWPTVAGDLETIQQKHWIHGSKDCEANKDPLIEVLEYDADTFILRQNKCTNYEAPFIYVLFGKHTVFVQDTGATEDAALFPLYEQIQALISKRSLPESGEALKILVTHSHGHSDHTAADAQFRGKPNVTLVEPDTKSVIDFYKFGDWPDGQQQIDLGERVLTIFPIPGHQKASVAVYDPQTKWLLSGDSFYPGQLYVKDWNSFRASIQKMFDFTQTHKVDAVMGTHIEMTKTAGISYQVGTVYQPDEASLVLIPGDLEVVNKALIAQGGKAKELVLNKLIVRPLNWLERFLSNVLG